MQVNAGAGVVLQPADDGLDQFLPFRSGHRQGQRILEGRFVNEAEPVGLLRGKRVEIQIKSPLEREAEKCGVPIQKPKVEIGRTTLDETKGGNWPDYPRRPPASEPHLPERHTVPRPVRSAAEYGRAAR